jgi:hypothetical protein
MFRYGYKFAVASGMPNQNAALPSASDNRIRSSTPMIPPMAKGSRPRTVAVRWLLRSLVTPPAPVLRWLTPASDHALPRLHVVGVAQREWLPAWRRLLKMTSRSDSRRMRSGARTEHLRPSTRRVPIRHQPTMKTEDPRKALCRALPLVLRQHIAPQLGTRLCGGRTVETRGLRAPCLLPKPRPRAPRAKRQSFPQFASH